MLTLALTACEGGGAGEETLGAGTSGSGESTQTSVTPTTGVEEEESSGSGTSTGEGDESSGSSSGGADDEGCRAGDLLEAPQPVMVDGALAVPIDVLELRAGFVIDVGAQATEATATLRFTIAEAGRPIFDLRQAEIGEAMLDGEMIDPSLMPERDLGGGEGAQMRVLGVELPACSEHTLELRYPVTTLVGFAAPPPEFAEDGVLWDFGFSDLAPRMYMEQWLPANLIHDRHPIALTVEVLGAPEEQRLISNGAVEELGEHRWAIDFKEYSTAMSPMLVVVPASRIESSSQMVMAEDGPAVAVELHRSITTPESSAELHALLEGAFAAFSASTGEYAYARFTAYVAANKGMEYDGGTTSTVYALGHEMFHSWYGRGARPMHARDGWIDEAWDVWNTEGPLFPVGGLDMNDPVVRLYEDHPWGRTTPNAAYADGRALFAAVAGASGVQPLRDSMRDFYEAHSLGQMTTQGLEQHLTCSLQLPVVRSLFHRFVYGLEGGPGAMPEGYCR